MLIYFIVINISCAYFDKAKPKDDIYYGCDKITRLSSSSQVPLKRILCKRFINCVIYVNIDLLHVCSII